MSFFGRSHGSGEGKQRQGERARAQRASQRPRGADGRVKLVHDFRDGGGTFRPSHALASQRAEEVGNLPNL